MKKSLKRIPLTRTIMSGQPPPPPPPSAPSSGRVPLTHGGLSSAGGGASGAVPVQFADNGMRMANLDAIRLEKDRVKAKYEHTGRILAANQAASSEGGAGAGPTIDWGTNPITGEKQDEQPNFAAQDSSAGEAGAAPAAVSNQALRSANLEAVKADYERVKAKYGGSSGNEGQDSVFSHDQANAPSIDFGQPAAGSSHGAADPAASAPSASHRAKEDL